MYMYVNASAVNIVIRFFKHCLFHGEKIMDVAGFLMFTIMLLIKVCTFISGHLYSIHKIRRGRYKELPQCEFCGFEARDGVRLRVTHAQINYFPFSTVHSPLRPRPFKNTPLIFQNHIASKHLHGNYVCPICNKSYTAKFLLNGHIRRVHSKRQLRCAKCSFVCKNPGNLRQHYT